MSNITKELVKSKEKEYQEVDTTDAVNTVKLLEAGEAAEDLRIANALGKNHSIARAQSALGRKLELEKLDGMYKGNVFTLEQIKLLARKYNLRFLQTSNYCGNLELDVISKIKEFNKETNAPIDDASLRYNYYILAPGKCFNLEKIQRVRKDPDPAIFFKIDEDKYRLIHQWGSDFSFARRISGWNWANRDSKFVLNLIFSAIFMAVLLFVVLGLSGWWSAFMALAPIFSAIKSYSDIFPDDDFHERKWRSTSRIV